MSKKQNLNKIKWVITDIESYASSIRKEKEKMEELKDEMEERTNRVNDLLIDLEKKTSELSELLAIEEDVYKLKDEGIEWFAKAEHIKLGVEEGVEKLLEKYILTFGVSREVAIEHAKEFVINDIVYEEDSIVEEECLECGWKAYHNAGDINPENIIECPECGNEDVIPTTAHENMECDICGGYIDMWDDAYAIYSLSDYTILDLKCGDRLYNELFEIEKENKK